VAVWLNMGRNASTAYGVLVKPTLVKHRQQIEDAIASARATAGGAMGGPGGLGTTAAYPPGAGPEAAAMPMEQALGGVVGTGTSSGNPMMSGGAVQHRTGHSMGPR